MAFSPHDVVPDSPINNFATLNPLNLNAQHSEPTNGNLTISGHSAYVYYGGILSSISPDKTDDNLYYAEFACLGSFNGSGYFQLAVATDNYRPTNTGQQSKPHYDSNGIGFGASGTNIVSNGNNVFTISTSFSAPDTSGIWQIAFRTSTGEVWFGKNGSFLNGGSPVASIDGDYNNLSFAIEVYTPSDNWVVNFGQDHTFGGAKTGGGAYTDANGLGQFYYQPPAGALALCTQNIPSGPINIANDDVPSDYFKAVTWTGQVDSDIYQRTGTSSGKLTLDMAPDLVWFKCREYGYHHILLDTVRGAGKVLLPNLVDAEYDGTATGHYQVSSFDSDGVTIKSGRTGDPYVGGYNADYPDKKMVCWAWKAAGEPVNVGDAKIINEDGTSGDTTCAALASDATNAGASNVITPAKVSANRKSGFSIVKYTGNGNEDQNYTIPHGLSEQPDFILFKNLDRATGIAEIAWPVQMPKVGVYFQGLDGTLAPDTWDYTYLYGSTVANSNVVTVRSPTASSEPNRFRVWGNYNFIMYCWHSVAGYSKFGSYVSTGSADGPFVELGFKPSFLMVKNVNLSGTNWMIWDNSRDPYNEADSIVRANTADIENNGTWKVDFLSNSFKIRTLSSDHVNSASNHTYIFAAFAESPMNAPSNAR